MFFPDLDCLFSNVDLKSFSQFVIDIIRSLGGVESFNSKLVITFLGNSVTSRSYKISK